MPEESLRTALLAEHQELKRRSEELKREHQRLTRTRSTRAERGAHHQRLQRTRRELERHYVRLRQLGQRRHLDRRRAHTRRPSSNKAYPGIA